MDITLQISDNIYYGYKYVISMEQYNNIKSSDLFEDIKHDMYLFFEQNNLISLRDGVQHLNMHIHYHHTQHTPPGDEYIIYVCTSECMC